jgi:hypothetical protein
MLNSTFIVTNITKATVIDNSKTRVVAMLDATRPFVAIAPKGFLRRVIGHYSTMVSAQHAVKIFNERNANAKE